MSRIRKGLGPCTWLAAVFVAIALALAPKAALAAEGSVAKIGDTEYTSFADAANAVQPGDTIELLADCNSELTNAWAIDKSVTIKGNYTLTFNDYSFGITGDNTLTLDGCKVVINNAAHTAYSDNPANAAIMLDKGGSLTLANGASLLIDSPSGDGIATWDTSSDMRETINILNGSSYECKNATNGGGIEDYNNETGRTVYVNITNGSKVYFHDSYSGFIASLTVTVDNSTVDVLNNAGNGSNGTYYEFKNGSVVTFDGNGSWGISAWRIDMSSGAKLTATNNGYSGIWTRVINADGTCTIDVEKNGSKALNSATAPGIVFQGNGTYASTLEVGSSLTIKNNAGAGIYTKQGVCNLTINSNAEITGNGKGYTIEGKYGADNGGGVYNIGTMILADSVAIYNNHAELAGDDIYSTKSITFGPTQDGWVLDGDTDGIGCSDAITGWYDDSLNTRWDAHSASTHIQLFSDSDKAQTGALALKAAHGLTPVTPEPVQDFDLSKSKTATNLAKNEDGDYTSDVTLSLPSAETKTTIAVAFVLDGSTSADQSGIASQAAVLLDELAALKNVDAQVSLTVFGGSVPLLESTDLKSISDSAYLADLKSKLTDPSYDGKTGRSGSNLQAGIEDARAKLDASGVGKDDRYLVILSDGAARMWYENRSAMSQAYESNVKVLWNSNCDWVDYRYKDAKTFPTFTDVWAAGQNGTTIGAYGMTEAQASTATVGGEGVASTGTVMSGAYYTTYEAATYYAATSLVEAAKSSNVIFVSYPYHYDTTFGQYIKGFVDWTGTLENVTLYTNAEADPTKVFASIKDEMLQLVDAGSYITDVIGTGTDNAGNAYDFDFVNDASALELTVGGEKISVARTLSDSVVGTTTYYFGTANSEGVFPYELTYTLGAAGEEKFVFTTNVAITKDAQVQLTYQVKLTNPQTIVGTYGQYDEDGSEGYTTGLLTNVSAALTPVDSNGGSGTPQELGKPTVSYTVAEKTYDYDITVNKVWKVDDGGTTADSVKANILQNGVVISTITLSEANGWSRTINLTDQASDASSISVEEVAVAGFTATVVRSGNTFTITNDDDPAPIPTTPDPAKLTLTGTKVLNGGTLVAGQFAFDVRQGGSLKATGTNDADGTITFSELEFATAGQYVFEVTEVQGTDSNTTYDGSTVKVVVDVAEADGKLVASIDESASGEIKFTNTYTSPAEPVTPTPTTPSTEPTTPTTPTTTTVAATTSAKIPASGDASVSVLPVVIVALAILGAAMFVVINRKRWER